MVKKYPCDNVLERASHHLTSYMYVLCLPCGMAMMAAPARGLCILVSRLAGVERAVINECIGFKGRWCWRIRLGVVSQS